METRTDAPHPLNTGPVDPGPVERARTDGPFLTHSDSFIAALVESAGDPIIGIDPHGIILSWNAAAIRFFGHARSAAIGRPIEMLMPHDRRRSQRKLFDRAVATGECVSVADMRYRHQSGHDLSVAASISPVRDWGGAVVAASVILRTRHAAPAHRDLFRARLASAEDGTIPEPWVPRNILVVEDEALIGLGLASTLENAGFSVIGPAMTVDEALTLIDRHGCALAILDVNLGEGRTSEPLAHHLKETGVPFIVTSAYMPDQRADIFNDVPSFAKPVGARTIVAAVQEALH